ncbi:MAG: DEAD/DEAH box helicase [Archaeoglobaceae archaeon]
MNDNFYLQVLDKIQENEERLINFGIYETTTTLDELMEFFGKDCDRTKLKLALDKLEKERLILRLGPEAYRSRIGEIVRLLYKVKQRFYGMPIYEAPNLVQAVKFKIVPRKQPKRTESLEETINLLDAETHLMERAEQGIWRRAKEYFLSNFLKAVGENFKLSKFQQRAIISLFRAHIKGEETGFVITAETGSGKTEAFLIPILLHCIMQKSFLNRRGTKALIIYPRIKLAENQLMRLVKYLSVINAGLKQSNKITVGIDYKDIEWDKPKLVQKWTKDGKIVFPIFKCPFCESRLVIDDKEIRITGQTIVKCENDTCDFRTKFSKQFIVDFILLSKIDIQNAPPDILIITTESLHRRLMDASFRRVFGDSIGYDSPTVPTFVIMDEIHLYRSLHGSQISLLMRRLKKRLHDNLREKYPVMVGVSATVINSEDFWSKLSGVPKYKITEISPLEEEKIEAGKEYYIFVKPEKQSREKLIPVLSTTIQTVMCVMHNMKKRPDKYKGLGFVDSIDTLKRWAHDQRDAERQRLYDLRVSVDCGRDEKTCQLGACDYFDDGECWWFARFDNEQYYQEGTGPRPLKINLKWSGSDVDETLMSNDLVLSTSSMEVGFDDPTIQAIFQHKSPMSPVSFAQRKGRGGRLLEDRPIIVAVLSPESPRDLFYYRRPEELYNPKIRDIPINPENYYIQRAHGLASLWDCAAKYYYFIDPNENFFLTKLHPWEFERQWQAFRAHMMNSWDRFYEPWFREVSPDYWKANTREGLKWYVTTEFMDEFRANWQYQKNRGRDVLKVCRFKLPGTLFASINVPLVEVNFMDWDAQNSEFVSRKLEGEDVIQTLYECAPGNVTMKYGKKQAHWIPPSFQEKCCLSPNYWDINMKEEGITVDSEDIPTSVKPFFKQARLKIYRPLKLWLSPFGFPSWGTQWVRFWLFCPKDMKIWWGYKKSKNCPDCGRPGYEIIQTSSSYPMSFTKVITKPSAESSSFYIPAQALPAPFKNIFRNIFFYFGYRNNEPNPLHIAQCVYGFDVTLNYKTPDGYSSLNAIITTADADGNDCLYGYELKTEGIVFDLNSQPLHTTYKEICKNPILMGDLRTRFWFYLVLTNSRILGKEVNIFVLDKMLKLLLRCKHSLIDMNLHNIEDEFLSFLKAFSSEKVKDWTKERSGKLLREARDRAFKYLIDEDTLNRIEHLLSDAKFNEFIVSSYEATQDDSRFVKYIETTLMHSLKHVLLTATQVVGGVDEKEVVGWLYSPLEYENSSPQIYIYENNMYGNGVTRIIKDNFSSTPSAYSKQQLSFLDVLDQELMTCPTGDEEERIEKLLLNDTYRKEISDLVNQILTSLKKDTTALEKKIESLLGIPPDENFMNKVVSTFRREKIKGKIFDNGQLHFEIARIKQHLRKKLHREPLVEEIQETALANAEKGHDPELKKLKETLNDERRFLEEVEKRSLNDCIHNCPNCLLTNCSLSSKLISRYILSRKLLRLYFVAAMQPYVILLNKTPDETIYQKVKNLLIEHKFVVIRSKFEYKIAADQLISKICNETISHGGKKYGVYRCGEHVYIGGYVDKQLALEEIT